MNLQLEHPVHDHALDDRVWAGVQKFLTEYANIEQDDVVIIAYSPDSRDAAAWVGLACEERGLSPTFVPMRPLRDPRFGQRLARAVPNRNSVFGKCVLLTFERDTMSHHGAIRELFASYSANKYRVVRAINAGRDLFTTGVASSPRELSALNAFLLQRLQRAKQLLIRTAAGTELRVRLDNEKYRFVSNRGVAQPRQFVIVPAGEVATFPAHIEGTLVADFAMNINTLYEGDARLSAKPVTAIVHDGELERFSCCDPALYKFLEKSLSRPNARRVGELGFGTNKAVTTPVRENSHLNERVPGVHLGFGQHNQDNDAAGYACDIHIDLCAKGGMIWFDDSREPIDLDALVPSTSAHPEMARDEDVFSEEIQGEDCCGLLSLSCEGST
jgi:hypothetical protein